MFNGSLALSLHNQHRTWENRLVNGRVEIFKRALIHASVRSGVAWRSEENTTRHLLACFLCYPLISKERIITPCPNTIIRRNSQICPV